MIVRSAAVGCLMAGALLFTVAANAADGKWGLKTGQPDLQSAGHLAFGPDGVLFVGDAKAAAIFAFDTGDTNGSPAANREIPQLAAKVSAAVGGKPAKINDLAVNPLSGNIYLSLSVGESPAIVRIDGTGNISDVKFASLPFQKAALPNPPEDKVTGEGPKARNRRAEAITDLAYVEGKVLVAGLVNAAAPSTVRELAFPFAAADEGTPVEIYHAAHGKVENYAAIRTFIPFNVDGSPALLAGFTCTPLVRFSLADLGARKPLRGTTVAELGNRNQPLDMILYERDGERFLLMANSARGVMKISTKDIGRAEGLTTPVGGGGVAGQKYDTIKELEGTTQLDRLNDKQAVVVIGQGDAAALKTVALP